MIYYNCFTFPAFQYILMFIISIIININQCINSLRNCKKCLMPDSRGKPANDCSASDEASRLDLYLQRQLEEDVAR